MELKGKKINFLGDSITEGVGTSGEECIFLNLLKEKCGLQCARNYGIGGTRIADYIKEKPGNLKPSFSARFSEMDDDADIVVVFGGTNDYGDSTSKLGQFGDTEPITFYGALDKLMKGLIEKYPSSQLVFMTPVHRKNELTPNPYSGEALLSYVQAIKEMAAYYSIPVLDLYAVVGIQPNLEIQKSMYCPDGLHPNDAGHRKIAAKLEQFLKYTI